MKPSLKWNSSESSIREIPHAPFVFPVNPSLKDRRCACILRLSRWQHHNGVILEHSIVSSNDFGEPPTPLRVSRFPCSGSPGCLVWIVAASVTFQPLVSSEENNVRAPGPADRPTARCLFKAVTRFIYRSKWVHCSCTLRPSLYKETKHRR